MPNRVVVTICDQEYTLVSDESPEYMQRLGSYVSRKMEELQSAAHVGHAKAAVLTALNIADELFKEQDSAESLRAQLLQGSSESSQTMRELSELKRENFRLQKQLEAKNRGK